jgi:hypothetical protein
MDLRIQLRRKPLKRGLRQARRKALIRAVTSKICND